MKKIILGAVVAAAAIFGGFTASQTSSEVAMSDLQLENVEALADPPEVVSSDEFHRRTGCICTSNPNDSCRGYDGRLHSFAVFSPTGQ